MGFRCDPETLARLEWQRLLRWLSAEAATERGREACAALSFAETREGARDRLRETSEARKLLDAGEALPFGGVTDLRELLEGLERGVLAGAHDLARALETLQASRRIRGFLGERRPRTPRLAGLADALPELPHLEAELREAVSPEGELRDTASPELARARRHTRELEREIERRMSAYLRDPNLTPHLQDHYSTFRENRPVLPVRADARGRVRGIVHDVSASGTTLFIEPEAVVELGNDLRIAQRELEREVERLLRQLGGAVLAERDWLRAQGEILELLDVAQARGRLSARLAAVAPDTSDGAPVALLGLRHPLLALEGGLAPSEVVPNDLVLPPGVRGLVISGPNAGGKTVIAKALALAALCLRAGLHAPCEPGSRLPLLDAVAADIGDEQDLRRGLSTFSARMQNVARIAELADARTLVVLDEIGEGTEPGEGAALALALLEALVERGSLVVATTHFNRLKELAGSDARFANASAEFDPETLLPTYRVHVGAPGSSGAMWVAERMGLAPAIVERARAALDDESRRLEALTRSLSELRQQLEVERRTASHAREQSEALRELYEARLVKLRAAREQALEAIRNDLESAYRSAREEIADVVRALQRGAAPDGRAANRAHRELEEIRERAREVEEATRDEATPQDAGLAPELVSLAPGARLRVAGLPGEALLIEGPDRRGRVVVRIAGTRLVVQAERLRTATPVAQGAAPPGARAQETRFESPSIAPVRSECDLRGLRVDEALERAAAHLDRLLVSGARQAIFIHGHGTGALRGAIRAWLREAGHVAGFGPGDPTAGGDGVTVATIES